MSEHEPCSYCDEGALLDEFGIKIMDLPASKLVLFKEQSHPAEAVHKLFNPDKVNYGAYGDTGRHLHFHLVPKYQSDPFEWGSTFAMNPNRTYLTAAEYDEMIAKYREALS